MTSKHLRETLPAPQPTRRDSRTRDWTLLLLDLAIVLFVLVVFAVVAGIAFVYQSNRILPGVQVLDVNLQGASVDEAAETVRSAWQQRTIVVETPDGTQTVAPAEIGLQIDAEATVNDAYDQSRELDTLEDVLFGRPPTDVAPVWSLDPAVAEAYFASMASQFAVAPTNAGLQVENGHAQAVPPEPGSVLDVPATRVWLQQHAAQVVEERRMPLIMQTVEPTVANVDMVVEQANRLLANQLIVRTYDPVTDDEWTWALAADTWGDWITMSLTSGPAPELTWTVDSEQIRAFLTAQTDALGEYRTLDLETAVPSLVDAVRQEQWTASLRVYHEERLHTVQAGETLSSIGREYGIPYPWIEQANPDLGDSLSVGQELVIPSPDLLLPLPVVENKRIIVSISEQRMWAYENGTLKWEWPVSTGIDSSPTAVGVFQVQSHDPNAYASRWDLWMPNFVGIYRPVPNNDFMNGFHGFPTRSGSNLLWTDDLGHPVTYGCILVSSENATALYEWAEAGVVVDVRP